MKRRPALAWSPGAAGPLHGTRPDWRESAACASVDPELFFPVHGNEAIETVPLARRVCAGCPVRAECLEFAMGTGIWHGVWGGLTVEERQALARSRRMGLAA